ncbi:hypothetical protein HPB48_007344 [Haemaphysalis longicornis]|uniref:Uncharacterized protein n=1 Tax=Haemaphysalis longicornis TaxID=44386 RepID=A0A9J6G5U8_HAELO|nr:hypothetical protein HPB48_007344 [Haemaphysalis longicornis]
MDHWCRPPEAFNNLSVDGLADAGHPARMDGSRSQCTRREPPDAGSRARIVPCEAWEFDLNRYGNNIISEWRLVCDKRWLIELAVMTYMTASAVALPLAGLLADRVGRIPSWRYPSPRFLITGRTTSPRQFVLHFCGSPHYRVGGRATPSGWSSTPSLRSDNSSTQGALLLLRRHGGSLCFGPPVRVWSRRCFHLGWQATQSFAHGPHPNNGRCISHCAVRVSYMARGNT